VACRTTRDQRDLLRIVRAPDGSVGLDAAGRSAGRGAYVCRDLSCITQATERGLLSHALTSPIPPAVAAQLQAAITTAPGGSLGQE
jgi:uncharacterized protein